MDRMILGDVHGTSNEYLNDSVLGYHPIFPHFPQGSASADFPPQHINAAEGLGFLQQFFQFHPSASFFLDRTTKSAVIWICGIPHDWMFFAKIPMKMDEGWGYAATIGKLS